MEIDWDLNIYFRDEWKDSDDDFVMSDTLFINPVVWTKHDDGTTDTNYTNTYIKTTFAETRYIRSQYPEEEYGYDWTDSLSNFLKIAPPRLVELLSKLPKPETIGSYQTLGLG